MHTAISDAANLTLINNTTGNVELYTPYANKTNIEFSSEQIYALAKGVRAVRFDYGKTGKLDCEFEVFELKFISILLGGAWTKGKYEYAIRETQTVSSTNTITLDNTPKTDSLAIFKVNKDDMYVHDEEQTAYIGTDDIPVNKYKIADKVVTFNATSCPKDTKVVAYYLLDTVKDTERLEIKEDEYPDSYTVIGDAMLARKADGVKEFIQFKCGNAKPLGQLTLTLEAGGVTNLVATFDLMADGYGNFMTITKIPEEEPAEPAS